MDQSYKQQLVPNDCGIYIIKNTINNKMYIGSSKQIKRRWQSHKNQLRTAKHPNRRLQNSWNKYGEHSFEFVILEECSKEELLLKEEIAISIMKPQLNLAAIINGKAVYPKETRERMHIANKGKKLSEETKQKISASTKGKKKHANFGLNQSIRQTGVKFTKERNKNISLSLKGMKPTEEMRRKMSEFHRKANHPENIYDAKYQYTKMNWDLVKELRALRKEGASYKSLVEKFGICKQSVGNIINYRSWDDRSIT